MSKKSKKGRFLNVLTDYNTLTKQNRFGFLLIATAFSALILAWFLFHITHGILYADEAFYLTIADRLAKGDKLILDEWQLSQFTVFFQYLPYRLYVLLTGSNDGVILYMRYLYTLVHLLTYWYIIFKLRKHPLQAIASAFLFCSFVPLIYAINYYTLPIYFILYVCLIISDLGKRFHRVKLIFIGILIACTVLTSPGFAIVWLIYAFFCLAFYLSEKKGKTLFTNYVFILNGQTFGWIMIGILIPAAAFLIYMQISCGWTEIFKTIPYLLTDPEYDSSAGGNLYSFFWSKLWDALVYYNLVCSCIMLILSTYIVICRKKILSNIRLRIALFLAASFCTVFMQLYAIHKKGQGNFPSVFFLEDPAFLLAWLGFDVYFLIKSQDRKAFLFWIAGVALSTVKDVLSDISFGESLIICVIPLVSMLPKFIDEITVDISASMRKGKNAKNKIPPKQLNYFKKGVFAALSLLLIMTVIWIVTNKYYISVDTIEKDGVKSCTERIEKGPHRGIYTSKEVNERLKAYFNDMDRIAAISEKAPHITAMMPYAYLYLDRPYPIFSTYLFASDDMKYEHRTETYWQLHPDKRPDIIYMPAYAIPYQSHPKYYDSERYEQMASEEFASFDWFEGTAIKGEGGVIFKVSKWKQPDTWN